MKELLNILDEARHLKTAGESFALATVIKIGGSTYRRPGARMLIADGGRRWGAISGGCLEGEVAQQAIHVMESHAPRVMPFDLQDDDIVLGFGTGCNGIVHVLIQPIDPGMQTSPIDALQHAIAHRKTGILATVIDAEDGQASLPGQHLFWSEDQTLGPSTLPADVHRPILSICQELLMQDEQAGQMYLGQARRIHTDAGALEVLFEIVRPPIDLQIYGEGHDVHAVVALARTMGWQVQVIGRKPVEILTDRFPAASTCRFLMHPEQVLNHIKPDRRSAALVMNHTYVRDKAIMRALLDSEIAYVGMLGPRERTNLILEELEQEGRGLSEAQRQRLFGPVGLDIGTETPEEIALSALSEIQAILHRRRGGSLRTRQGPIHAERTPINAFYGEE